MAIFERDGYRCVYCGATPANSILEADHVVPQARGGLDEPTNLVTACQACNGGKGAAEVGLPDSAVVTRPLPLWFLLRHPTPTRHPAGVPRYRGAA